jgi:hypothetical protein
MTDKFSEIRAAFHEQAAFCRESGSPMTGEILEAAIGALTRDTETGRMIFDWSSDPAGKGDNLMLRLTGGLHALARSGEDADLTAAYAGKGAIEPAVTSALVAHDSAIAGWLASPPQTNEVSRAALIMAGLLVAADHYPLPIDLLEIGSSAGLVLNLNRYRYDLGGVEVGEPTSPLLLTPQWKGSPPPASTVNLIGQRGVDRNPIYLSSTDAAEKLIAYIWPDQPERIERAEQAIALARAFPPPIVAGEAADWVEAQLAMPLAEGVMRILFHTITMQYFSDADITRVETAIDTAGAQASAETPFGWLSFEMNAERRTIELRLKLWPRGDDIHLADAHPHGASVDWLL